MGAQGVSPTLGSVIAPALPTHFEQATVAHRVKPSADHVGSRLPDLRLAVAQSGSDDLLALRQSDCFEVANFLERERREVGVAPKRWINIARARKQRRERVTC